jgi:hypothetical protein
MEDAKFQELLEQIVHFQARLYKARCTVIDKFIALHPELLEIHDMDWYYKNL